MFDALKSLGNLPALMARAKEMQDKVKQMQEEIRARRLTADAGAGVVEATVNGRLELLQLKIDKARVDVSDTEMLEDLIVAAVNAAQAKAAALLKSEMQRIANEMGIPPGMMPM